MACKTWGYKKCGKQTIQRERHERVNVGWMTSASPKHPTTVGGSDFRHIPDPPFILCTLPSSYPATSLLSQLLPHRSLPLLPVPLLPTGIRVSALIFATTLRSFSFPFLRSTLIITGRDYSYYVKQRWSTIFCSLGPLLPIIPKPDYPGELSLFFLRALSG